MVIATHFRRVAIVAAVIALVSVAAVWFSTTSDPIGQDPAGTFFLDIESPAEADTFVSMDILEVAGRTTLDAVVIVNDSIVDIDADGRFVSSVSLIEGPNVVEVVASNADGEQLDRVLLVIYEPV